jgi:hypothetical protein
MADIMQSFRFSYHVQGYENISLLPQMAIDNIKETIVANLGLTNYNIGLQIGHGQVTPETLESFEYDPDLQGYTKNIMCAFDTDNFPVEYCILLHVSRSKAP